MAFGEVTPERRLEILAMSKATRAANAEARRNSTLRKDFLDAGLWLELASARRLTLPPWGQAATVGGMQHRRVHHPQPGLAVPGIGRGYSGAISQ